jgi:multidrug efflux pump subunit AcrB
MIRFLINRPISVFVVYTALALLALLSLTRIPVSLLPDIAIPQMTILVEQANYSAREIENKILKPLRQRILQVDGIESLEGIASHESGLIRLRFAYGRDIDYAFLELNEKIDLSLNSLPEEVQRPRLVKASASELPAFYLSINYKEEQAFGASSFIRLSEFADQIVRRRLEQLESIALVDISGTSSPQIVIEPKEALLKNLGITQTEIQQALEMADLTMGSIKVRERKYQYLVRLGKRLASIQDVKNTALRIGGRVFKLNELATIRLEESPSNGLYFFNNKRGISLAVIKNSSARMEDLEKEVAENLQALEADYPSVHIEKSRDQLFLLNHSLQNLQQSLIIGGFLAIFIVFLFYKNWRVSVIIAIIIPSSLILSLLFFYAFGLSMNIISLAGLILGLGLMIDNGIIVLDNINQFREGGNRLEMACIAGTNEMIRPLLASMLTTCSVFFPLVLLSGISGALFYAQALSVSIGLVISYLVSITLLPVLYFVLEKNKAFKAHKRQEKTILQNLYEVGYRFTFKFPFIIICLAIALFGMAYWVNQRLTLQQLPDIPRMAFEVYLDWNENIQPEIAQVRIQQLMASFRAKNITYNAHVGQQQYLFNYDPLQKSTVVHLYVHSETEAYETLQKDLKESIQENYPKASFQFLPERNIFEQLFPTNEAALKAGLLVADKLPESALLNKYQAIATAFKQNFPNGTINRPKMEEQVLLIPKMEQLLFYDITSHQVFQELKRVLGSRELLVLKNFNVSIPLVIKGPKTALQQLMETFKIKSKTGNWIPIRQLVTLKNIETFQHIYFSRNGRYLPLEIDKVAPEKLFTFFKNYEKKHPTERFQLTGTYFKNTALFKELLMVLAVSILLLYFIMAAQFESLLQPFIILIEIPISLSGALLFLYLGGETLNAMAFIGMVVTAGIIINDSIIKIDTINRLRKAGHELQTAIHLGGIKRLNPIIMTSLTSILAVLPFLWGTGLGTSLQKPLALALIGGMLFGTMVSLFFIPLVYSFFYKNR